MMCMHVVFVCTGYLWKNRAFSSLLIYSIQYYTSLLLLFPAWSLYNIHVLVRSILRASAHMNYCFATTHCIYSSKTRCINSSLAPFLFFLEEMKVCLINKCAKQNLDLGRSACMPAQAIRHDKRRLMMFHLKGKFTVFPKRKKT